MLAANWSNFKTSINNTFKELRKEVNSQISREIKRPYPANPKVKKIFPGKVNNRTVQK
jgi:hypothetical protein